ncbi:MAG: type II secretion system protein [Patescibacteria group bacterium]
MKFNSSHNKGFTLIELLVVVAIISLLSSIVLASLKSAKDRADVAKIVTEARQFKQAMETYRANNNSYPPITSSATYLYDLNDASYPGGTVFRNALLPYIDINKISFLKKPGSFILQEYYNGATCAGQNPPPGGYMIIFAEPKLTTQFKKWQYSDGTLDTDGRFCFVNE